MARFRRLGRTHTRVNTVYIVRIPSWFLLIDNDLLLLKSLAWSIVTFLFLHHLHPIHHLVKFIWGGSRYHGNKHILKRNRAIGFLVKVLKQTV